MNLNDAFGIWVILTVHQDLSNFNSVSVLFDARVLLED